MDAAKKLVGRMWRHFMHDSLYRNSILITANTVVLSLFGFLYWGLGARFYTQDEVGITATLITVSTLISALSIIGFDKSFIRFLPRSQKREDYLHTGFTVSIVATVLSSLIYLAAVYAFIPKLGFLHSSVGWTATFVVFMVTSMLTSLAIYAFVALRLTHLILIVNIAFGLLRLALLPVCAQWGEFGLIAAHIVATLIGLALILVFMKKYMNYHFRLRIVKASIRHTLGYSLTSYISGIFSLLPGLLLPTFVIAHLSAAEAAYFYIVSVIVGIINIIPSATAQSLFTEGSWDETSVMYHFYRALRGSLLLVVPAVLLLIIVGKFVLGIFGGDYAANGYVLLLLLSLSGIPKTFSFLLGTILRVRDKVAVILSFNVIYAVVLLSGSVFAFKYGHGVTGIGWATLIAETLVATLYLVYVYRFISMKKLDAIGQA